MRYQRHVFVCTQERPAGGKPEGLVARSLDRAVIAKLRFEDYRRTLKRRHRK